MQPQSAQDYKLLLTEVIKKQIVILGPDITLSKARNVKGLVVQNDGTVTDVTGSPQEVTQALIDQFVQLSGLIVKKTMEPLLLGTQQPAATPTPVQVQPVSQVTNATMAPVAQQPTDQTAQPAQAPVEPTQAPQPTVPAPAQPITPPAPTTTTSPQPEQPTPPNPTEPVQPASNPLAA